MNPKKALSTLITVSPLIGLSVGILITFYRPNTDEVSCPISISQNSLSIFANGFVDESRAKHFGRLVKRKGTQLKAGTVIPEKVVITMQTDTLRDFSEKPLLIPLTYSNNSGVFYVIDSFESPIAVSCLSISK